ncbi:MULTISPECIES: hypothetical protein [unclassified Microbacterium]|uniref:hypothetical protein n=1 Tax=unclassified Microbacterium TaxID=2609290 RepID=UPI000CFF4339|nr:MULTISPECIES: hypothetical protein [unclassified Microbacterium]PRB13965.1 hypothetical protein CQ040_20175 [Microbacterium sp. MYb54]PRB57793.1 hypothetical protein CQ021_20150 [Microbacterium sp. MYb24]PRB64286.1 hypothetical protein CQ027_20160 [Microbacterium sp. MYb32]
MAENNTVDYDALSARLTDPSTPLAPPQRVWSGDEAAAQGRAFLLREYGSEEALEEAMRAGRPRVGSTKNGPSPVVRGAIPAEDYEAFQKLVNLTGMKEAQLVRRAVHKLLVGEQLVDS